MTFRVSGKPIPLSDVKVQITAEAVILKGIKGEIVQPVPQQVSISCEEECLKVKPNPMKDALAIAGTIRALLNNHVQGVTKGFSKKLLLVGVGYRAQVGKTKEGHATVQLTLGLSHPVVFVAPAGIDLSSAAPTEITVQGVDRQKVGQVAAEIRSIRGGIRRPDAYKGKGIRYADEVVKLREIKKQQKK